MCERFGVAALAKWAVSPQLDSGAIVGLSLTEQGFRRTWSAAQVRDARRQFTWRSSSGWLAEHPIPQCDARAAGYCEKTGGPPWKVETASLQDRSTNSDRPCQAGAQ